MSSKQWRERTELLLGAEGVDRLDRAHVLVVGLGGVGGMTAEMLVRGGVGRLTIVDADTVQPSNLNRQIVALTSTLGQSKASALATRLRDINPEVELTVVEEFLQDENMVALLDAAEYDFVVDAIDSLSPKVYLISLCLERSLPIISSMGAGAKSDPASIVQADLSRSHNCHLARMLRKRLRKLGITRGVPVVYSRELPDETAIIEITGERCKKSTAGTISYMPALFGCHLAAYVLRQLSRLGQTETSEGESSEEVEH